MKYLNLYLCTLVLNTVSTLNLFATDSTKNKAPDSYLKAVIVESLKKTSKIKLDLYVMSFCPYGVNAEKTLVPILQEMEDRIEFNIFFIVNEKTDKTFQSLHGEPEVLENRRQLVIARHFPSLFLKYLLERSSDYSTQDWSRSAVAAGLNVDHINELVNRQEEMEAFRTNIANSNTKKIFGSPSLFINGIRFRGSFSLGTSNVELKCDGGLKHGQTCVTFEDCYACEGGFNDGEKCLNESKCHGICEGGNKPNGECLNNDTECGKRCVNGARHDSTCTVESDCPGGSCSNIGKCNLNKRCNKDSDCLPVVDWFFDGDGDNYYGQQHTGTSPPDKTDPRWSRDRGSGWDCDDQDKTRHPGAAEPCGPPDKNCDGVTVPCPQSNIRLNSWCVTGHIALSWETEVPIGVDNFFIERSTNGILWEQVGVVDVPGISVAGKKYSFTDIESDVTSNFYRVIAYTAGSKRYSDLVASPCPSVQNLTITPNPVRGVTIVSIPSLKNTTISLSLYNSKGVLLQVRNTNLHIGSNQFQFDLDKLSPGLYILTGKYDGAVKNFKIIKP